MNIEPIAYFRSPLTSKFGIPRQSGLVPDLSGHIVFTPEFRHEEAIRGLEEFDYLWIIWEFSQAVLPDGRQNVALTVRPPRLGGNKRVGVFASRSPFRPNSLGLSSVRIDRIEMTSDRGPVIHVLGADLMDGTPIYDIKPYITYADSHPEAKSGFVDSKGWNPLTVNIPENLERQLSAQQLKALKEVLAQDPRPRYHDDPERTYGMPFDGIDIRFQVNGNVLTVTEIIK
jgi:tRNA-Thr(GGU) m(6)t(6)A37 methyltransferase TsaA